MAIDRSASTTLPIQEVGIVLCLDSSIPTLQFWHDASPAYIQPLIQSIWKKNVSNQYENTVCHLLDGRTNVTLVHRFAI